MIRYGSHRLIGLNEMFGAGLIVVALGASMVQQPGHLPFAYVAVAMLVAGASGYAGYQLVRLTQRGLVLSLWLQGLQVLNAARPTFDARLELGLKATLEVTRTGVMTRWGFGGMYGVWPWPGAVEGLVVVNGLALVAFLWLWRYRKPLAVGAAPAPTNSVSAPRAV